MKTSRILSLMVAFAMLFTLLMPQMAVFADDSSPKEPEGTPIFSIYNDSMYTIDAGVKSAINIVIQNVSFAASKKTMAVITDDKNIFTFPDGNVYWGGAGRSQTMTLGYFIMTPEYTVEGRYPLTITLTNTNYDGVVSSQTLTVYVNVKSDVKSSTMDVLDYSIDREAAKAGEPFNLTIKLKNNSGASLTNAHAALQGLTGDKFAMNTGLSDVSFDIAKEEEKTLKFSLVGCKGIASIREIIPLKITYYLNPADKNTLKEVTVDLSITCVSSVTDQKVFAPNIIIDSYSFGGDYVLGGKTFPLDMTIRNTSTQASIQNLKVTIQGIPGTGKDTSVAYSPANSSNSFFFENLGTGASQNIKLDLIAKADATPDSYPLQVVFDYEYTANGTKEKASTVTETIRIPLQQDDRFTANPPEVDQMAYVNQEFPVNITLVNKGKSSVYNVTVDVEGEGFEKTGSAYYIGNVESGKEEYYDTRIIPSVEGEIKGEIVISYEDSNGNAKEIRQEFITNAMQMMMPDFPINDMPTGGDVQDGAKPPVLVIVIIAVGVVVLGAGVFITLSVLKKKKLKAKEIEEDNEDI